MLFRFFEPLEPILKLITLEDFLRPILHFPIFLEMITDKSQSHLLISQDWRGHILEFGIFEEQNSNLPMSPQKDNPRPSV